MKKIYLAITCLFALLSVQQVSAQTAPTVVAADLPQIGTTYPLLTDSMPADMATFTVTPGSASAQTWNYSTGFNTTYSDPVSFVTPSSGTNYTSFPTATMAAKQGASWAYFLGNAAGLNIVGVQTVVSGSPATINYTPYEILIATPFTYGSTPVTNNYNSVFNITVSGLAVQVHHHVKRLLTPDAFGSLATPAATYASTLRVKSYETDLDSIFLAGSFYKNQYDTAITYNWLQNSTNLEVMEMDFDLGKLKKVKYSTNIATGIEANTLSSSAAKLYPNPASEVVYLEYTNTASSKVSVELFDIAGRHLSTFMNENQAAGTQTLSLDLQSHGLAKGMYLLRLTHGDAVEVLPLSIR
jgi:hypothetical protein